MTGMTATQTTSLAEAITEAAVAPVVTITAVDIIEIPAGPRMIATTSKWCPRKQLSGLNAILISISMHLLSCLPDNTNHR